MEQSRRKAKVRLAVTDALAALPPAERVDLLVELIAELDAAQATTNVAQATTPERREARPGAERAQGHVELTLTDKVVRALEETPGLAIADLATKVYGARDRQSQSRTRSLLAALKTRGLVHRTGPGRWRAGPEREVTLLRG